MYPERWRKMLSSNKRRPNVIISDQGSAFTSEECLSNHYIKPIQIATGSP